MKALRGGWVIPYIYIYIYIANSSVHLVSGRDNSPNEILLKYVLKGTVGLGREPRRECAGVTGEP